MVIMLKYRNFGRKSLDEIKAKLEDNHLSLGMSFNEEIVAALQDHILPIVPGIVARLNDGIDVVDIGCGAGRALKRT